ncbi:MAG: haloacid dehalogenase [Chloroflexota bacterium]
MSGIDDMVLEITDRLTVKGAARDAALLESRQIVRLAANAIRALHRGESDAAEDALSAGREMVASMKRNLTMHPDLYWAGYVQDAQKEIAEAHLVAAMIAARTLPAPSQIGVEDAPFLNGLAEAASEMRRYILDIIRRGGPDEMEEAERALNLVDDVYINLITVDFPDALTGGLRRTVDSLRAVLERTRGDLTISMRQAVLARALMDAQR